MWEGANRIDIVHTFAPWQDERCQEACSVDGVCCCLMPAVAGAARLVPVSEDAPLNQCQHFVAAALMDANMEAEGSGIVPFYSRLGAAVLGTVMDGDCGIDTMCMMLRRPQTIDARKEIRQELHDYLMERVREPWMQDIMQACQEISADDLEAYRSCGEASRGHAWAACAIVPVEAGESQSQNKGGKVTEELLEALAWSTGVKDTALLVSVAADLSDVLRDEQLRKHALAKLEGERQTPAEAKQVLVFPNLLRSRMQVAKLYHDHLRSCGWQEGEKEPWGARTEFMGRLKWGARGRMRWKTQSLGRWLRTFLAKDVVGGAPIRRATPRSKMWSQRQRGEGGGRSTKCEWLRQELFEWWSGVRYAVDWSSIKKNTAPEVVPKKIARFTQYVIKAKAKELLSRYVRAQVEGGVKVEAVVLRSRWFAEWRHERGLSLRKPNRRYKVSRAVMAERCEIGWLNVARVRAAVAALKGYDPHIENWDQSPLHHNETGVDNKPTLAVAGVEVPLVEGHNATRARWTANLTTFSDHARLTADGPPYAEHMFKADGEEILKRLRDHIRKRGYSKWVSVATSEKGSYRTEDVLTFLETHLPQLRPEDEGREWRIILADDHRPHLSPHVARLCWQRGYVFIPHGGGVTPVLQTPDTDLNGPVKARYTALESAIAIRKMRDGVCVPHLSPEECVDIMVEVLSDMSLHHAAADGYVKTGLRVSLDDSSQDHFIVREAATFWKEQDMRAKVNAAVAEVREEVAQKRLTWCYNDIRRLIRPYPKRKHVDEVFANLGEDTALEEGEKPYEDKENDSDGGADTEASEWSDAGAYETEDWSAAVAAPAEDEEAVGNGSSGLEDTQAPVSAEAAEHVTQSTQLMTTYAAVAAELERVGAVALAANVVKEQRKEARRMRKLSAQDPGVLVALQRDRDQEAAEERKRLRLLDEMRDKHHALSATNLQLKETEDLLKTKKRALLDVEQALEAKRAVKAFSLSELGEGRPAAGAKARHEVLDRLARLGEGISPAQRNDYAWFKKAWDKKMLAQHGAGWPALFASWSQRLLDAHARGDRAAFSAFMHDETKRCFGEEVALVVP